MVQIKKVYLETLTLKNPIFLNKLNEEVRRLDNQIELFNKKIKEREGQTFGANEYREQVSGTSIRCTEKSGCF